jgi:hypothetical protein
MGNLEQLRISSLAFLIASCSPVASLAQTYFGISAGLANNILVGSEIDFQKKLHNNSMSHRTGPALSLILKKELSPGVYLKGEASYIRKGNTSSDNLLWSLNLEYFSVPLKIGFQPLNSDNSRRFQLGIEFGPSLNVGTGQGIENLKAAYAPANKSKVSKWAIGLCAGSNFEYRLSPRRILFLNGSWYHDLTPLLSYQAGNARYKAGNQGWMLMFGVLLPIRK